MISVGGLFDKDTFIMEWGEAGMVNDLSGRA